MRLWRRRTSDERREDIQAAILNLGISFTILSAGFLLLTYAVLFYSGTPWLSIPGALIGLWGFYAVAQSLFGLLEATSAKVAAVLVVLELAVLVFIIFQAYRVLME